MTTLVSVIIPTYNRYSFLGETLESILHQSYKNWECIVIDDTSDDYTAELMEFYCNSDERIKYLHRPMELPKGANSCRNFGFSRSKGSYVIWFDSDDMMTWNHIESKVNAINEKSLDFIIGKTRNFKGPALLEPYTYEIKSYGIKAEDFVLLKIHWYTYDAIIRREVAEKISWNVNLNTWQDYNYFCKMLLITENGSYLSEIITHRRLHPDSIQSGMRKEVGNFWKELLEVRLLTFVDIGMAVSKSTRFTMIHGMMNLCFDLFKKRSNCKYWKEILSIVIANFGRSSGFCFFLSLQLAFIFGRGHFLLNAAKRRK